MQIAIDLDLFNVLVKAKDVPQRAAGSFLLEFLPYSVLSFEPQDRSSRLNAFALAYLRRTRSLAPKHIPGTLPFVLKDISLG